MLRMLVCGLAVLALGSSLLLARPGVVKLKDGTIYEGDVTEKPDAVEMTGVAGKSGVVALNRATIEKIVYPDDVAKEVHEQLQKMDPKDAALRLTIAKLAYAERAYAAAQEALQEAAKIDPANKEVSDLLATVTKLLPPPATMPATNPAVATTNPVTAPPKLPPGAFVAKRMVTPAELNRIKQVDWHIDKLDPAGDEAQKVQVKIKADTRKSFQEFSGMKPAEVSKLTAIDLASRILAQRPDLAGGVLITNDPSSVADFKKGPRTILEKTCVGCHSRPNSGIFHLFPGSGEAAIYTNYLTLRNYSIRVRGADRSLVDTTNPNDSLLLQFLLQPGVSTIPHPDVPGAKGPIRVKTDPKYVLLLNWITNLSPVVTQYGIDLSTEDLPAPRNEKK